MTKKIVLIDKIYNISSEKKKREIFIRYLKYLNEHIKGFSKTSININKLRNFDQRFEININGQDENFIFNLLQKEIGTIIEFKDVKEGQIYKGSMVDVGKVGFGIFVDCAILNPKTDVLINELVNSPKSTPEDTILTLAIPRAVRALHDIRNKKDVAHVKSIDPDSFDIHYCETSCDWILSQFVSLVFGSDSTESKKIIDSLCEKKIPWIQEFENGSTLLLLSDLNIKNQILLALYHHSPNTLNLVEISDIIYYKNQSYMKQI